jgi:uncharacterized DUF497 family protein
MIDDEFEWDDDKAASNAEKHGVTFEQARSVFRDPFAIELLDDREVYSEDRYILIGMSTAGILVVVHTQRGDRSRIISARKAEPNERRFYHDQT